MSIFNSDKSKINSSQNVNLEEYEKRIAERAAEYQRVNKILRGMRSEVSKLMEEIKKLSDEVVKKNAEVFLADQKLEQLNQSHQLLKQNIDDEQEVYLNLVKRIEQLKIELKSDLQFQEKLNQVKTEYNMILTQIKEKKSELEIVQNLKNTSAIEDDNGRELSDEKNNLKNKLKRCIAKTKNGAKCKRTAVENSDYCAMHLKQIQR